MRIISIDPGYERLGIAILDKEKNQKEKLLFSECFKTSSKLPHSERLNLIGEEIIRVIKKWKPEALATEKLFFSTNQKTAMLVSEARGVILYSATSSNIPIFEYAPTEIKIAITGYGRSEKRQMISMVGRLISVPQGVTLGKNKSDDEYDAIAVGLTHFAIQK